MSFKQQRSTTRPTSIQGTAIKKSSGMREVELNLKIIRGRSLIAKDSGIFSKKKSSDPYAIIYLEPFTKLAGIAPSFRNAY